jgi:hypothetical protein
MALIATEILRVAKDRATKAAALIDRMEPFVNRRYDEDSVSAWINGRTVPPADVLLAAAKATDLSLDEWLDGSPTHQLDRHDRRADVTHVFTTRSEFTSHMPPHKLFDGARQISASGISLNLLCQQYSTASLRTLLEAGCQTKCLFLAPGGAAMLAREEEENYKPGELSRLTQLNIDILLALRRSLPSVPQRRLEIATYDSTVRFNIFLINETMGVIQPYLPLLRGIDSPTLVLRRREFGTSLFVTFAEMFDTLWRHRTNI